MQNELDRDLQSLFLEQNRNLSEEPFLSETLKLVEKRRNWRALGQNLLILLAVILCASLSRFFIQGSILLSGYLDWIFETAELFINTPAGILSIALFGAISLLVLRRRIFSVFV